MNFLELCVRLHQEADTAGSGPTSVLGNTGELANEVNWVADAWTEIQGQLHWDWQWQEATVTVLTGTSKIATSIAADRYVQDAGYIGTRFVDYYPWHRFRMIFPEALIASRPAGAAEGVSAWTVAPDKTLRFNAIVDADTAITVERYANPTVLAANTDTPAMDSEFHMAIVWHALIKNHNFNEAGISRQTAQVELNKIMKNLHNRSTPQMILGGPLL